MYKAPIGVNIEEARDYSSGAMFVDAMLTAKSFTKTDGSKNADGTPAVVSLNPDGSLSGNATSIIFSSVAIGMAESKPARNWGGEWTLIFDGKATVSGKTPNGQSSPSPVFGQAEINAGQTRINFSIENRAHELSLTFINPVGVKNIRLIRPGYQISRNSDGTYRPPSEIFTHEFLEQLKPFSVLRTMDILGTNGSLVNRWSDRSLPFQNQATILPAKDFDGVRLKAWNTYPNFTLGVAWENIIEDCINSGLTGTAVGGGRVGVASGVTTGPEITSSLKLLVFPFLPPPLISS
jgi:hypothetical protein